jgi:hypothetical protein
VRAFLWAFIRVLPRQLAMGRTNHLPGLRPDGQRPQTAQLGCKRAAEVGHREHKPLLPQIKLWRGWMVL